MKFYLYSNGEQTGPHSFENIRTSVKEGVVKPTDLVWEEGWSDWKQVSALPGLLTPPLPSSTGAFPTRTSLSPIPAERLFLRGQNRSDPIPVPPMNVGPAARFQKQKVSEIHGREKLDWSLEKVLLLDDLETIEWRIVATEDGLRSVFFNISAVRSAFPHPMRSAELLGMIGTDKQDSAQEKLDSQHVQDNERPHAFSNYVKRSKINTKSIVFFVIFGFFIPSIIAGGNPYGVLMGFVCGVLAFRSWCERRTFCLIIKRQSIENYSLSIYLPSLWSFMWRSFLVFLGISLVISLTAETVNERGRVYGAVLAMWFFPSLFVLDVPFWALRRVRKESHMALQPNSK